MLKPFHPAKDKCLFLSHLNKIDSQNLSHRISISRPSGPQALKKKKKKKKTNAKRTSERQPPLTYLYQRACVTFTFTVCGQQRRHHKQSHSRDSITFGMHTELCDATILTSTIGRGAPLELHTGQDAPPAPSASKHQTKAQISHKYILVVLTFVLLMQQLVSKTANQK